MLFQSYSDLSKINIFNGITHCKRCGYVHNDLNCITIIRKTMTETESNGKRIIFKCGMVYIKWFFSTINNGKRNCVIPVNVDVESVYGATMHLCKPSICNKKKRRHQNSRFTVPGYWKKKQLLIVRRQTGG